MIITIDGVSASGKGSLARMLSDQYTLPVLGTGSLWRLLAFELETAGVKATDVDVEMHGLEQLDRMNLTMLDDTRLVTEEVGRYASIISGFLDLRNEMDEMQRQWAARPGGGIIEGRETGISIAPQAEHKFFLIAHADERAQRRAAALGADPSDVFASLRDRDFREINRPVAPIRPAPDALIIDTTDMDIDEVFDTAAMAIEGKKSWVRMFKQYSVAG